MARVNVEINFRQGRQNCIYIRKKSIFLPRLTPEHATRFEIAIRKRRDAQNGVRRTI